MGRVFQGDCDQVKDGEGVAGIRVYLEDGRYAVTDADGKYHFEGLKPGSHVVQLDTITVPDSMEPVLCTERVRHAGRSFSQFVDLRGGALWRADFVLRYRPLPNGSVALDLATAPAADGALEHTVTVAVDDVSVANAQLLVMLPPGLDYLRGSVERDGKRLVDPPLRSGVIKFELGALAAGARPVVRFRSRAARGVEGQLAVKAMLQFDSAGRTGLATQPIENVVARQAARQEGAQYTFTPRFDVLGVELDPRDRAELDRIVGEWRGVTDTRISVIGHADRTPIAARNRDRFPDNYALSRARAQAVAGYLARELGLPESAMTVEGRGSDEPVAEGNDPASLARNRRVEISVIGVRTVQAATLSFVTERAAAEPVTTVGERAPNVSRRGPVDTSEARAPRASLAAEVDLAALSPGIAMLSPAAGEAPPIPSLKVAIQHGPADGVTLSLERQAGQLAQLRRHQRQCRRHGGAEPLARRRPEERRQRARGGGAQCRGRRRSGAAPHGALRRRGGAGRARDRRVDAGGGRPHAPGDRVAHGRCVRQAGPSAARWDPSASIHPIAPGGRSSRPGTTRRWRSARGSRPSPSTTRASHGLSSSRPRRRAWRWSACGSTTARTRRSAPGSRPRRATGSWSASPRGPPRIDTLSDNMEAAAAAGLEDGFDDDGRVAFFAKGRIKGEFLLTVAYDSARDREEARRRLFGVIEPDRYYTLYGDSTEQRFEAASTEKLFLKLERRQFDALFGDFDTGLTVTELGRYSRSMTGLKTEYAGERFGYSAFAADSEQGFVRDELRGDGTSGLYRLSESNILANSDKLRIEVRDRFRSEIVVESRSLTRFIDYNIDYDRGTVFFKQPVPSRDDQFNPVWIVAEYEVLGGGGQRMTAGGRVAARLGDGRAEIGASFVQEGSIDGPTRVGGADLRVALGAATELKAEVARSESDDPARAAAATAYLAEIEHVTERLDARAYLREQEAGFGVGQQFSTEGGTRKAGVDGRWHFGETFTGIAELFMLENLDTGAERRHVSAELRQDADNHSFGVGVRRVEDTGTLAGDVRSDQAFVRASLDLFGDRVTARAGSDFSLGGRNESVDYPARSTLGLDYHLSPGTTLFAEYEHADGSELASDMTRMGVRATPWNRAQLTSSLNQEFTEFGPRVFANVGLTQGWQVNDQLALDFGVDQSNTLRGANLAPLDENVPLASGTLSDDFFAAFVGALYRTELWTANARVEHRNADLEERWSVLGGLYREPVAGHAFSAAVRWLDSDFTATGTAAEAGIDLGWAFRPVSSQWIVLNRLELENQQRDDLAGRVESSRIVNNLNANWQLDARTQLGLQLGLRYVTSTFDGERYNGFSDLYGVDLRRDLTRRFDVGLHGTWLHSWRSGVSDAAVGADVGVTVARNVWVSVGYNFAGFDDDDFSESRYTAQGPFIKLRIKADQETFRDLLSLGRFSRNRAP